MAEIQVGDEIEGEIVDLTREGLGFFRHPSGKSVFVLGAWLGERGRFVVEEVAKRYVVAKVLDLEVRSPARRASPCPHFGLEQGRCGSCLWIGINYEEQVKAKALMVTAALKQKKIPVPTGFEVWPSPVEFGYRNRAQVKTDGERVGYVSRGSKALAEVERCLLLNPGADKIFQSLRQALPRADWKPEPPYLWNFIDLDDQMEPAEVRLNHRRPFRQANDSQNERMKNWVGERCQSWTGEALELFAGSGNFTEVLCRTRGLQVVACELSTQGLSVRCGDFANMKALALDLYRKNSLGVLHQKARGAQYLFLDPPRDGYRMIGDLLSQMSDLREIIYVSCNLNSFSMDAFDILGKGFKLVEMKGVDQFPQTPHIELLAHFERR